MTNQELASQYEHNARTYREAAESIFREVESQTRTPQPDPNQITRNIFGLKEIRNDTNNRT